MSQNTFDIFDDTAGRHVGQQEKATRRLIESLTERSGGVSVPPYDSLNLGLHVNDS